MAVPAEAWEYSLVAKAHEALRTPISGRGTGAPAAASAYAAAYRYCAHLVKYHSPTFYLASALLPRPKCQAVRALYAFCRATDDLVDQDPPGDDHRYDWHSARRSPRATWMTQDVLDTWTTRLAQPLSVNDPVPLAWADTKARYQIPDGYERQLIEGIARDLRQHRYETFADLADYCYGVASTVGLMVMHIVGFRGQEAVPYAVKLGVALQLTNILRDVAEDWRRGRLYLPLEELAHFGLLEANIACGTVDDRWRAFMREQIAWTRTLYAEAAAGIALLDADGRFAIAAASGLYGAILEDIEAHDFDVFSRRAHVGTWGKLRRLPGIWWAT